MLEAVAQDECLPTDRVRPMDGRTSTVAELFPLDAVRKKECKPVSVCHQYQMALLSRSMKNADVLSPCPGSGAEIRLYGDSFSRCMENTILFSSAGLWNTLPPQSKLKFLNLGMIKQGQLCQTVIHATPGYQLSFSLFVSNMVK